MSKRAVVLDVLGWIAAWVVVSFIALAWGGLILWAGGCAATQPQPVCAPRPPTQATYAQLLKDAEAVLGPLPIDCVEQLHATEIVGDMHDMPEVCWRDSDTVVGCNAVDQNGYPHIWIVQCQREPLKTLRMERLHTLLRCIGSDDPNHERPIWDTIGAR